MNEDFRKICGRIAAKIARFNMHKLRYYCTQVHQICTRCSQLLLFNTPDISQGSVASHLRCGEIFSNSIITNFLLILTVK